MAKKKVKNKVVSKKYSKYKVSGDNIERKPHCPKCGPGIFLAVHKDRKSCGKCHYTEFQSKEAPKPEVKEAPKEEKPKEAKKDNEVKESS